jgi:predicted nucleic acid-binding protein
MRDVLSREHIKEYGINVPEALKVHRKATISFELDYPIKRYFAKDQNDEYLIALALQTNSGFITSGDSDILSEKVNLERRLKKLKILTKAQFEEMFSN